MLYKQNEIEKIINDIVGKIKIYELYNEPCRKILTDEFNIIIQNKERLFNVNFILRTTQRLLRNTCMDNDLFKPFAHAYQLIIIHLTIIMMKKPVNVKKKYSRRYE